MRSAIIYTTLSILMINFSCSSAQKSSKELIVGDWVEVRKETRIGYTYIETNTMQLQSPCLEFSFHANGNGDFLNYDIIDIEPKSTLPYKVSGSKLIWGRTYDILKLNEDTMILQMQLGYFPSDNDHKCYFIRKNAYKKLMDSEVRKWRDPNEKDIKYRDSCIAAQDSNRKYDMQAFFVGGWMAIQDFFRHNIDPNAVKDGCKGTVYMKGRVDVYGNLKNVEITKSDCPKWNDYILLLIPQISKWHPAFKNGKYIEEEVLFAADIGSEPWFR